MVAFHLDPGHFVAALLVQTQMNSCPGGGGGILMARDPSRIGCRCKDLPEKRAPNLQSTQGRAVQHPCAGACHDIGHRAAQPRMYRPSSGVIRVWRGVSRPVHSGRIVMDPLSTTTGRIPATAVSISIPGTRSLIAARPFRVVRSVHEAKGKKSRLQLGCGGCHLAVLSRRLRGSETDSYRRITGILRALSRLGGSRRICFAAEPRQEHGPAMLWSVGPRMGTLMRRGRVARIQQACVPGVLSLW